MSSKPGLLRITVLAAAGLLLAAPIARAQSLLFNSFTPQSSAIYTDVIGPWLKDIEKETEGRVKFSVPAQSLAPPPEQLNMVTGGVADAAYIYSGFLQLANPTLQMGFLPGVNTSGKADAVALWRTYQKFFAEKNPVKGVHVVGFFGVPPAHIFNIKKESILSLEFYRGKKAWAQPGPPAQTMAALGASVVPGPAVRAYDIVSKGIVDAFCCIDFGDLNAFKLTPFVGAVTRIEGGIFAAKFTVFFSQRKWAEISPRDREIIMKLSGEALARRSEALDLVDARLMKAYKDGGGIIAEAPAAFNAALKQPFEALGRKWIESVKPLGIDGRAALDFYLAEAKKVAAGN